MIEENDTLDVLELDESLADVEKPPEIPAGAYVGEIQDVQVKDAQSGNRYYAIKFVISPDNLPADIRDNWEDGAVLYWNRNIVPKKNDRRALYNLRKLMEALGFDANTTTIDPNEWMGREARLRIVHGKYQGETRAEIRAVEPAEAPAQARGQRENEAPKGKKKAAGRGR